MSGGGDDDYSYFYGVGAAVCDPRQVSHSVIR